MKKKFKYYITQPNQLGEALSNKGIYDFKDIESIKFERLDDYANEFLVIIEYK